MEAVNIIVMPDGTVKRIYKCKDIIEAHLEAADYIKENLSTTAQDYYISCLGENR